MVSPEKERIYGEKMAGPKNNGTRPASRQRKPETAKTTESVKEKNEAQKRTIENDQNQFWSVVLFAAGILIAFMVLIKGTAGWRRIHNMLLGLFGAAVIFVPITLIFTAVQIGAEKSQRKVTGRAFWGIAMAFLFSAALQIFAVGELPGRNFWNHFSVLYSNGTDLKGGGVASLLIAGPLLGIFGGMGARIVTIIMFFVFGMLMTGKGLMDFFRLLLLPFRFMGDCIEGLINVLMGGNFEDAFEDDYFDDDKEKIQFDEDLEAIGLIEKKYGSSKSPARNTSDDGFIMDIPLPSDSMTVRMENLQPSDADIPADDNDENLEALISRAAGGTSAGLAKLLAEAFERRG